MERATGDVEVTKISAERLESTLRDLDVALSAAEFDALGVKRESTVDE
ncbi:hypothetical protein [Saccharopolyspora pogona]|nr:hypothetical protein [Saccharopolyspora pogona]